MLIRKTKITFTISKLKKKIFKKSILKFFKKLYNLIYNKGKKVKQNEKINNVHWIIH